MFLTVMSSVGQYSILEAVGYPTGGALVVCQ